MNDRLLNGLDSSTIKAIERHECSKLDGIYFVGFDDVKDSHMSLQANESFYSSKTVIKKDATSIEAKICDKLKSKSVPVIVQGIRELVSFINGMKELKGITMKPNTSLLIQNLILGYVEEANSDILLALFDSNLFHASNEILIVPLELVYPSILVLQEIQRNKNEHDLVSMINQFVQRTKSLFSGLEYYHFLVKCIQVTLGPKSKKSKEFMDKGNECILECMKNEISQDSIMNSFQEYHCLRATMIKIVPLLNLKQSERVLHSITTILNMIQRVNHEGFAKCLNTFDYEVNSNVLKIVTLMDPLDLEKNIDSMIEEEEVQEESIQDATFLPIEEEEENDKVFNVRLFRISRETSQDMQTLWNRWFDETLSILIKFISQSTNVSIFYQHESLKCIIGY